MRIGYAVLAESICFQVFHKFSERQDVFLGTTEHEDLCMLLSDIYYDISTAGVDPIYLPAVSTQNIFLLSISLINPRLWDQKFLNKEEGFFENYDSRLASMQKEFYGMRCIPQLKK